MSLDLNTNFQLVAQTEQQVQTRFIHGALTQQSKEAVQALHDRFKQKIDDTVKLAIPADSTDELRKACFDYCVALNRTRQKISTKQLGQKAAEGVESLQKQTKLMLTELTEFDEALTNRFITGAIENVIGRLNWETQDAAQRYCFAVARAGKTITPVELMEKTKLGNKALEEAINTLKTETGDVPLTIQNARQFKTAFENGLLEIKEKNPDTRYSVAEKFKIANEGPNGPVPELDQRIYFKLDDYSSSPVRPFVEKYVTEKGFTITDYAEGYAVDAKKNQWRIGKILKDAPGLLESYQDDPYRIGKNLMVIVTRNYEDLARGSYGRGWKSCRANASTAVNTSTQEIDLGVMTAYLVSADDPDIHNPLGRVNIKPYHRKEDGKERLTAYFTFNPIGIHHPGFVDAVNQYVTENLNVGLTGSFQLAGGCESYREFDIRTLLPDDAEAALKLMGTPFTKDKNGQITVKGELDLSGQGLYKLPDFSNVIVEGDIDVSKNKLLTLHGLPKSSMPPQPSAPPESQAPATMFGRVMNMLTSSESSAPKEPQVPVRNLKVSGNLLSCFAGAPEEVSGRFNYQDNPYLLTALGAPRAKEYAYGNAGTHTVEGKKDGWGDPLREDNHSRGATPVNPYERPELFPGFKRNK